MAPQSSSLLPTIVTVETLNCCLPENLESDGCTGVDGKDLNQGSLDMFETEFKP